MTSDGRQLESLVEFVERTLAPQGLSVKTNTRVFDEDGVQIAEFDVEISGTFGSTEIKWLIECRDRPGHGAAPGSWIEQLVGRRARFGFHKVTAVSTTGFAAGAADYAKRAGIELREVAALAPDNFSSWLALDRITQIRRTVNLLHASIVPADDAPENLKRALATILPQVRGDEPILRSSPSGDRSPVAQAFLGAVNIEPRLFDDVIPDGPSKKLTLQVEYTGEQSHFEIDTPEGPVCIRQIVFDGELRIDTDWIPLQSVKDCRDFESKVSISQVAVFSPQSILDKKYSFEFHRIGATGETLVVLRATDAKQQ